MRVGLVRHFKVSEPMPSGWLTALELQEWRERYDLAELCPFEVAIDSESWARCYASDLARAEATARRIYFGEIQLTAELREAEFGLFPTGRWRFPVWVWRIVLRLAWMTGHSSQRQFRDDFRSRVRRMVDMIDSYETDALLVSHAGMMLYLRKELLRRGYRGPRFSIADHARLYIFERN
jgi:broad specificity phosphatase PhoE